MTLPRFVHLETTRHGKAVVYFRRGAGPRYRLPTIGHPLFARAYRAALSGQPLEQPKAPNVATKRRLLIERTLRSAIAGASARAAARGLPFSLSLEWALETVEAQDLRCALTGIPFYQVKPTKSLKHPYAPSLDRIVPARGYVPGTVRIVTFAINVMLSDWGSQVFEDVAEAYRNQAEVRGSYSRTNFLKLPHLFQSVDKSTT